MIAALGFLFILAGGILILTTYAGNTGQVLTALLGSGGVPTTGTAVKPASIIGPVTTGHTVSVA